MRRWIESLKQYLIAGLCVGIASEVPYVRLPHNESVVYLQAGEMVEDRDHTHRENRAFVKLELSRPISVATTYTFLGFPTSIRPL